MRARVIEAASRGLSDADSLTVARLDRRAKLIHFAISAAVACGLFVCAMVVATFSGDEFGFAADRIVVILFIAGERVEELARAPSRAFVRAQPRERLRAATPLSSRRAAAASVDAGGSGTGSGGTHGCVAAENSHAVPASAAGAWISR
jgi:hypothetical protein